MFNGTIKKKVILLLLVIPVFFLGACNGFSSEDEPEYSIVGTWGMVSGLFENTNGTSIQYDKLHEGMYYSRYEFKENGILIQTQYLGIKLYGRYEYDKTTSTLILGWEPFEQMDTASVVFASENEMTIITKGILGVLTQDFVRIVESYEP